MLFLNLGFLKAKIYIYIFFLQVIRKDGDLNGYSSTLAMIPDLQFSFSLLMNGARPASRSTAQTVIDKIVPTLVDILRK